LSDWFFAEFTPRAREDSFTPALTPGPAARDVRDQLF